MDAPSGSITFAILAGGAATRLGGRDKGLQLLDGRPLIAWVIDAVSHMPLDPPTGSAIDTDEVRLLIAANRNVNDYARHGQTVTDRQPGFPGPLAGVAAALAACTTDWLITLPVDCPDPPRDLAWRLIEAIGMDDTAAIVAHDGERRQPLFAIYRQVLATSAQHAVDEGQGVWQWQTRIGARELDFSDRRRQFRNLNTPEDFASHVATDDT